MKKIMGPCRALKLASRMRFITPAFVVVVSATAFSAAACNAASDGGTGDPECREGLVSCVESNGVSKAKQCIATGRQMLSDDCAARLQDARREGHDVCTAFSEDDRCQSMVDDMQRSADEHQVDECHERLASGITGYCSSLLPIGEREQYWTECLDARLAEFERCIDDLWKHCADFYDDTCDLASDILAERGCYFEDGDWFTECGANYDTDSCQCN